MSVFSYSFHSVPLKLSNKGMDFLFPPLKLPNKGIEEYFKMILFISFHSLLPKEALSNGCSLQKTPFHASLFFLELCPKPSFSIHQKFACWSYGKASLALFLVLAICERRTTLLSQQRFLGFPAEIFQDFSSQS